MKNKDLKKIAKIIKKASSIAIFSHTEPDFDAIGSALGLKYSLELCGKRADFISSEKQTEKAEKIFGNDFCTKKFDRESYDLFINMDNPARSRCEHEEVFGENTNSILLDHHKSLDLQGKYNYTNTNKSSCAEIVLDLLEAGHFPIDKRVASCLYAGLSTDSGAFINTNTNADSFLAAYKLLKYGANSIKFNEEHYRSMTEKELNIRQFIYNHFKIEKNIAFCTVSQEDMKNLKANKRDFSQISSELIKFDKANVSFSVVEKEPKAFYFSFRAKEGFPVRDIAEKFGGGGHLYACAGKIVDQKATATSVAKLILKEVKHKFN